MLLLVMIKKIYSNFKYIHLKCFYVVLLHLDETEYVEIIKGKK